MNKQDAETAMADDVKLRDYSQLLSRQNVDPKTVGQLITILDNLEFLLHQVGLSIN